MVTENFTQVRKVRMIGNNHWNPICVVILTRCVRFTSAGTGGPINLALYMYFHSIVSAVDQMGFEFLCSFEVPRWLCSRKNAPVTKPTTLQETIGGSD